MSSTEKGVVEFDFDESTKDCTQNIDEDSAPTGEEENKPLSIHTAEQQYIGTLTEVRHIPLLQVTLDYQHPRPETCILTTGCFKSH